MSKRHCAAHCEGAGAAWQGSSRQARPPSLRLCSPFIRHAFGRRGSFCGAAAQYHIAAFEESGSIKLAAASPVEFARALGRPDLDAPAAAAENFLNEILDEAARPLTLAAGSGGHAESGIGATEDQMNMRGTVPQRIDNRGSKVEELAGTGEQDSRGG